MSTSSLRPAPAVRDARRRPVRPALALAVLAFLLVATLATACGSDADSSGAEADGTGSGTGPEAAASAFPVTVEHDLGETVIEEPPKRVVSVGVTEQDTILALGVKPVGVTEWYGEQPYATWPWAQEALGDSKPEVLSGSDGFQYERIAALKPDLIIGTNAGIDADSYEKLSAIAPTVAHPSGGEGNFAAWDDQTLLIGQALGLEDEATELVDGIKDRFTAVAEAHPEWAGTKVIFLQNAFYDGEAIAYQDGLSTEFLTDLGFEIPEELDAFEGEEDGSQAYVPLEQLSVLDNAELLIWGTEKAADRGELEKQGVYNALDAVKDGRLVFTDGLTAGAIYFTSVLSLPFVLDYLVPALEDSLPPGDGPVTIESHDGKDIVPPPT